MSTQFSLHVRAFEDGKLAYEQQMRLTMDDTAEPMAASKRMVEEFTRGYHGIKKPTPWDLTNVMCNELYHLLRQPVSTDERRTLFVSGSVLQLCALPLEAKSFLGMGRMPGDGERLMLTIHRKNLGEDKVRHTATVAPIEIGAPPAAPIGTA